MSFTKETFFGVIGATMLVLTLAHAGCPFRNKDQSEVRRLAQENPQNPLFQANEFLLTAYDASKTKIFESFSKSFPLIVADGTKLQLLIGDRNDTVQLPTQNIDMYKMVSHTALTSYVLVSPLVVVLPPNQWGVQVTLDSSTRNSVLSFMSIMLKVQSTLDFCCEWNNTLSRQQHIVTNVIEFLAMILKQNSLSKHQLDTFSNHTAQYLLDNINDYAIAFLNMKNDQMNIWKQELTELQWSMMRVVVLSSHMARWKQIDLQYFSTLLNTPIASGYRVMYAEGIEDADASFSLVSTHFEDFNVGYSFFGDPEFMHYDIFATPTQNYLPTLLNTTKN